MQTTPNNSKALAIITYITLIGWIIAFVGNNKQNNSLVTYHQRQALGVQLIYFSIAVLITLTGIPSLQVLFLGVFILMIIGISNASNQINKPLPLVGTYFEKWFESIV
mgnify:FL=1